MATQLVAGSSQYFEFDSTPITSAPFSIHAWVYCDSDPTLNDFCIFQISDLSRNDMYYRMSLDDAGGGALIALANEGGATTTITTTSALSQGTWHSCLYVEETDSLRRILLDGGSKATSSQQRILTGLDRISVGREGDSSPTDYWNGMIADMAIWNAALTDDEAVALARGIDPRHIQPAGLVRLYTFLDGTSGRDWLGGQTLTPQNTPTQGISHAPRTLYTPKWAASVPLIETGAAPSGRIMGALTGPGGLAGPGGIAGRRGGLAA